MPTTAYVGPMAQSWFGGGASGSERERERERSVLPATDACSMWARPDYSFDGFVGTSAAIAGQPGVSNLRDL